MAIPEMTDDLNIISGLSDRPNQDNALSSADLKARFDKGPNLIKSFLNTVLVPALNKLDGAVGFKGGHEELTGRDGKNQHPMDAIDGLVDALAGKAPKSHNHSANEVNEGVLSTDRIPVVPIKKGGTGGSTRNGGFTNLAHLGVNPVTVETDTPAAWIALGDGFASITQLCTVGQTAPNGVIINLIVESYNVQQLLITADGALYIRGGGKSAGWVNNWRSPFLTAGGTITGKTTLKGPLVLTRGVHYGTAAERPAGAEGQIYLRIRG